MQRAVGLVAKNRGILSVWGFHHIFSIVISSVALGLPLSLSPSLFNSFCRRHQTDLWIIFMGFIRISWACANFENAGMAQG